jgi:hypothetical protein
VALATACTKHLVSSSMTAPTPFRLVFLEVGTQYSRQYTEICGSVDLTAASHHHRDGYNIFKVDIDTSELNCVVPIPSTGATELYMNEKLIGSAKAYTTPSYPNPYQHMQVSLPGGRVMKATSTASIPLPDSLPMKHWIQTGGSRGDYLAVKIGLKRLVAAHNIHSDSIGNMYIYLVNKVYLYVKN